MTTQTLTSEQTLENIRQQTLTSSSSETDNEALSGMCPVFFQLLPSNLQCEEGERLLLSCQVMAGTQCQIQWCINEHIINENMSRTRRHYSPDTGICFIIIDPALSADSGVYRLIIANRSGQAQTTCQVQIQARQLPPMPDDNLNQRLHFVRTLPSTSTVCRDGDTIQLMCVVHGRRPIQIRWYKDEQRILIDEKQQHTRQIYFDALTGKSTLTIHDVYPSDSGVYRCEASNTHERESTSTTVDVTRTSMIFIVDRISDVFVAFSICWLDFTYDVDSEMSSASFVSSPPSDHEDVTGSQSYPLTDDNALYEESRRIVAELDARIADLSSENTTIIENVRQQQGKYHICLFY
jgi:hypothetical protein